MAIEDAERRERCHAKAAALTAGAAKLMTDFIAYSTWGQSITLDVTLDLLEEARDELRAAAETVERTTAVRKRK